MDHFTMLTLFRHSSQFVKSFVQVVIIYCLATLHLAAGVEQPFDCLVIQNRRLTGSMRCM